MTTYFVYDVFTDRPFGGNQLAVFPDASLISDDDIMPLAREFNFSEVAFVYPPIDPNHTARVRIVTPTFEVPFAGHPVIGTAVALADAGYPQDMVLELGIGPLACHASDGKARFTIETPLETLGHPSPELIADALGISPNRIIMDMHGPTLASLGLPFTITQLDSRETLSSIEVDVRAMRKGHQAYPLSLDFSQFVYVREGDRVHARMFSPLDNIMEDAATGSACATMGALLTRLTGQPLKLRVHQGVDMGRPSIVDVETQARSVTVSGQAMMIMKGQLAF